MRWLGALWLLAAFGYADEAEVAARMKWGEARGALEKADRKSALTKFEEALQGLPSHPPLLYEAAQCAYWLGEIEKADRWMSLAVRSEDPAFKQRPDYQDVFTFAAKVHAARQLEIETADYDAPELIEGAVRSAVSLDDFVKAHFETDGKAKDKLRLKASTSPGLSAEVQREPPYHSCSFVLEGIRGHKMAKAVGDRIAEAARRELPRWEQLAAQADGSMAFDEYPYRAGVCLGFAFCPRDTRLMVPMLVSIRVEEYTPPGQKAKLSRVVVRVNDRSQ